MKYYMAEDEPKDESVEDVDTTEEDDDEDEDDDTSSEEDVEPDE
jgi:hypothetical protein